MKKEQDRVKRMRNIKGLLAVCLLFCMLLTGCQIGDKSIVVLKPLGSRYLFQIGDVSCSIKEAKVYLANYQNIYGEAYTLNLWEHDFGNNSLEEYIKTITLNKLVTVTCMTQLAEQKELMLTEEEEALVLEASKSYYETLTEEDKDYLGVSESEIAEYYTHYALAQKVYHFLTGEINGEVSDDEARVMEVMQIYVSNASDAAAVQERLFNGEDFASVANMYNELSSIYTNLCRDDLPEEAETVVFAMDDGEVSGLIEVENGYYFIKCLDKYNQELTEANKSTIVEKREKEALDDVYNEFIAGLSSNINEAVWAQLKVDSTSGIQTDNFFEIYDMYF